MTFDRPASTSTPSRSRGWRLKGRRRTRPSASIAATSSRASMGSRQSSKNGLVRSANALPPSPSDCWTARRVKWEEPAVDEAIRLGRHLLARDRLCEPVYRALMRLHAGKEERSVALKIYATCRDALKQELGVAPEAKTEELYRDILTDRPPRRQPRSKVARRPIAVDRSAAIQQSQWRSRPCSSLRWH